MKKLLAGISLILISVQAYANPADLLDKKGHINGINYTTLEIKGKTYEVPMANREYVQDLYYLKKAIKGDKDALDLLLQGKKERWIPIGDTSIRWLRITSNGSFDVKE